MEGTSHQDSEHRNGSLILEPVGYAPLLGQGVAGGPFFSSKDLIELSFQRGHLEFDEVTANSRFWQVHWRHWFSPSFNATGGIAQLTLQAEGNLASLIGSQDTPVNISAQSRGFTAALGNRWNFGSFTLGCDWLGIYIPAQINDFNLTVNSSANPDDADFVDKEMRRLAESPVLTYLRLAIGVVF